MGLDRRGFIKFLAGGAAGSLVTPIPWKLTDDASIWTQNWPWIPKNVDGQSEYVKTVSKLCPSNCGLLVRTVGGQPIRTIGDPDNPLSGGKVSSLAAAEVQLLYSEARLKRPQKKTADGAFKALSWEEAEKLLAEKLKEAGSDIACVSGDANGTINDVLSAFLAGAGSSNFFLMPSDAQPAAKGWKAMGGTGQVGYDLENSDFVLALGADILESWGPAIRNRRAFSAARPHGEEPKCKYYYAGPTENNTGAGADKWIPINPGTEAVLALGLAKQLIDSGAASELADFYEFSSLASGYGPDKVQQICGVSPEQLKELAQALKAARTPVVIAGSSFGQGAGAAAPMAGFALNILLGRLNQSGGMVVLPEAPAALDGAMTRTDMLCSDFVDYIGKSTPKALIVYEANPVYSLPSAVKVAEAIKKIPFKVSLSQFMDETAMACDLILPIPMGLERLDDVVTPYGLSYSLLNLARPVIKPLVDAKPAGDFILSLSGKVGASLYPSSYEDVLKAKAEAMGADFDSLKEGEVYTAADFEAQETLGFGASVLGRAAAGIGQAKDGVKLAAGAKLNVGAPNVPTPPFNMKTIRDTELLGNEIFVWMNAATAGKLGLAEGAKIKLSNDSGECKARVHLDEGVMAGVAAAPLGFGHSSSDVFTEGKGDNISKLLTAKTEAGTGVPVWTETVVNIAKI